MAAKPGIPVGSRVFGKRVAVIGAGSVGAGWGNGKAAAVLYAREGAAVLCVDRDTGAAGATAAIIHAEGGVAHEHTADVTDPAACRAVAEVARTQLGGLDILHCNVGISTPGGITQTATEDWDRVLRVNLDAAFHITRASLPLLEDGGGAIVYISSLVARINGPYRYIGYEVSKAALCRMASSIAMEYADRGVRVNTVLPGMIDTPHVTAMIAGDQDEAAFRAGRAAQVPMRRQGSAWDVAEAALFLASDAAGFITGTELRVDGGAGILMAT